MSQKEWPRIGRYIGLVDNTHFNTTWKDQDNPVVINVIRQQKNRVYGDEIELANDRIKYVRNRMLRF